MKILLFIITSFFITSCVYYEDSKDNLINNYNAYILFLNMKDYDSALAMLTSKHRTEFKNQSNNQSFPSFFPFFSNANTSMVSMVSHYQKIEDRSACLTLNGFSSDSSEPFSLSFTFLKEKGLWRFDRVSYIYDYNLSHSTGSDFPSTAYCPAI